MTFYKPLVTGSFTAETLPPEKPQVRCGRCGNNGTGIRNPECTARVHDEERAARLDREFSDEEMAAMLIEWGLTK